MALRRRPVGMAGWLRTASQWGWPIFAGLLVSCQLPGTLRSGDSPDRLQFPGWVKAVAFSEGGQTLIAGGCQAGKAEDDQPCARGVVSAWRLKGMEPIETLRLPKAVTALAVSPDGAKWVAGDSEGRLIQSTSRKMGMDRPLHHKAVIQALAFSPDGHWVASGSLDSSFPLGLMDMKTGGVIKTKTPFEPVSALAFSRDGTELGVGMENGSVVTWRFTAQSTPVPIAARGTERQAVTSLAFSPDDRLFAYGRQNGQVVIVDRASGNVQADLKRASAVTALAFSPDGQYLALGQENGKVVLVESDRAKEVWSRHHVIPVADLAYSPDGFSLAVGAQQGVFLYQMGDLDPGVGPSPHVASRNQNGSGRAAGLHGLALQAASSRTLARVLQITQDEYLRLLPFDRLTLRAVEAMVGIVPGAAIKLSEQAIAGQALVTAGGASMVIDLKRLRQTQGHAGIRESVRMYESAQRVLLSAGGVSAATLEDVAVAAVLSEVGPGVRLVSLTGAGTSRSAPRQDGRDAVSRATVQVFAEPASGQEVKYLAVAEFDHSTAGQIERWLSWGAGVPRPSTAYVLDLRNNAGADLESVLASADRLLPRGMPVAELIMRKSGERLDYRSKGARTGPRALVVLVNERTGGSAELLACAIRESGVGVLVGTRTAGIDEIYSRFSLSGGRTFKISSARFYCPGERSIRWTGQPADVVVDQSAASAAVPLGLAQTGPIRRTPVSNFLPVSLPNMDDQQLRVGIEIALCLSQASQQTPSDRPAAGPRQDAVSWLHACR